MAEDIVKSLATGLDRYTTLRRKELLDATFYAMQHKMVPDKGLTESERAKIMQGYADILKDLDKQQTILLQEYEKTGRVSETNATNLIAALAKLEAAAKTAQGGVLEAQAEAAGRRLDDLEKQRRQFGVVGREDLPDTISRNIGTLSGFTDRKGGVREEYGGQFGKQVNDDLRALARQDPRLIMPYVNAVEAETGVPISKWVGGEVTVTGIDNATLSEVSTILKEGARAQKKAREIDDRIVYEKLDPLEDFIMEAGIGGASGIQLANLVKGFRMTMGGPGPSDAEGMTSGSSVGGVMVAPPPDSAGFEERAAWVKKMDPRLELRQDGRIYETVDRNGNNELDSFGYDEMAGFVRSYPDQIKSVTIQDKPYLEETRGIIKTEMDRILNSDDPTSRKIREGILESQQFKAWAAQRGYDISEPDDKRAVLKILLNEHRSNKREKAAKRRMQQDLNTLSGADKRPPLEVAGAAARHGLRSIFKPEMVRHGNPSAAVTNGAETPAEKAPEVSEAAPEVAEEKAQVAEPVEFEGEGGYKYRINGDQVSLIGGPKSKATPEKPIQLKGDVAKKVLDEKAKADSKAAEVKGTARDKSGPLYQHEAANTPPPSKGEIEFGADAEKARARLKMLKEDASAPASDPVPLHDAPDTDDAEPDESMAPGLSLDDYTEGSEPKRERKDTPEEPTADEPAPKAKPRYRLLQADTSAVDDAMNAPSGSDIPITPQDGDDASSYRPSSAEPTPDAEPSDLKEDGVDEGPDYMGMASRMAKDMGEAGRKASAAVPSPVQARDPNAEAREQERQAAIADPKRRRRYELLYGLA